MSPDSPAAATETAEATAAGVVYTPAPIVRFMVQSCLKSLDGIDSRRQLLDLACGEGAFLCGAEIVLREQNDPRRWHLCGVDIDARAIDRLYQRWIEMAALEAVESESPPHQPGHQTEVDAQFDPEELDISEDDIHSEVVIGDALTGRDFSEVVRRVVPGSIDWPGVFPEAAAQRGFDIVIGNPPYIREKNAKVLFDRVAGSPLGQRWRQPRMDLWHYFLHRGLDLLRPGGILCFIVNSYWPAATSARPLIARLRDETTIERVVLLGAADIFPGIAGRHMILQLRKGTSADPCRVDDLSAEQNPVEMLSLLTDDVTATSCTTVRSQASLYQQGQFILRDHSLGNCGDPGCRLLGERFIVRQGIAENPPFVTRRMSVASDGTLPVGSGVFVLTPEEADGLRLSPAERRLLKPYSVPAAIDRFDIRAASTHWLLYLTKSNVPDIHAVPKIREHLERFRVTLERRREVQNGAIGWWHLHWPRQETLFTRPRVLAVQMVRRPTFAAVDRPLYVGFSVNVIQAKPGQAPDYSLPTLSALLNSQPAADWFETHAKHRGVHLDISGTVLRSFPLPAFCAAADRRLADLLTQRTAAHHERLCDRVIAMEEAMRAEIESLYGVQPATG